MPRLGFGQPVGQGTREQLPFGILQRVAGVAELAGGVKEFGVAHALGCAALEVVQRAARQGDGKPGDRYFGHGVIGQRLANGHRGSALASSNVAVSGRRVAVAAQHADLFRRGQAELAPGDQPVEQQRGVPLALDARGIHAEVREHLQLLGRRRVPLPGHRRDELGQGRVVQRHGQFQRIEQAAAPGPVGAEPFGQRCGSDPRSPPRALLRDRRRRPSCR